MEAHNIMTYLGAVRAWRATVKNQDLNSQKNIEKPTNI